MPLRSVKMKRFIFGFQRRVWCPKWTPLSSSWRIVTTAMVVPFRFGCRGGRVASALTPPAHRTPEGPAVAPRPTGVHGRSGGVRSRLAEANRCPQCTRATHRRTRCNALGRRSVDRAEMRLRRRLALAGLLGGVSVALALVPHPVAAHAADAGWAWPVPVGGPAVLHGFAPPDRPWLPGHRGVDLRARAGAVVRAAGPGRVHFAGRIGRMWVVSVLHPDGLLTTYEPVRPLVRRGAWVRRGQPIGLLLRSGSHCGSPCLHWGLRRGPASLDPLALVGEARVRLLPLYPPDGPLPLPSFALAAAVTTAGCARGVSRAGRRACRAAAALPWCASGRSGSRSRRGPGRSRRASGPRSSRG